MQNSEKAEESIYYDITEAWEETKSEFSNGTKSDKAVSSAKLLGKTLFNTGVYAGKLGFKMVKELPNQIDKMQLRRDELREKLESKNDFHLKSIINSGDGFFASSDDEKIMAKKILNERNGE